MKLMAHIAKTQSPVPPTNFGHYELISKYGVLGNDKYGDCVWVGAAHENMMWRKDVGLGFKFSKSAMAQFNVGKPWDVVEGSPIVGGHYVPRVARRNGNLVVITWGQIQAMTPAFFEKYKDESIVYLTKEDLKACVTPEGFNVKQLTDDLAALQ